MVTQEQSTQTDQTSNLPCQFCNLKLNAGFKFMSSLLLPLALGVFTVIITFQQQKAAKQQRIEDQIAAEQLRELERKLDDERYKNDVLDMYIRDLATLLKDGNGSLTNNEVIATVAQVKTLNIFRQLDPSRNNRVLRFLYETKALTDKDDYHSLDLSKAKLYDIDFRELSVDEKQLEQFSLIDILLLNTIFTGIEMNHVNFTRTYFDTASFASGQIYNSNFSSTTIDHANFSSSHLKNVDFTFATLKNIDFSTTSFSNVDFSATSHYNVNFSYSSLVKAQFSSTIMHHINFSFANLNYADFSKAKTSSMDFRQASCVAVSFHYANLSYSNFWQSNARHALFIETDLSNVNFSHANLYKAVFLDTHISDNQLQSALSIEGAKLPNGTIARDVNMISNGHADCNISAIHSWTVQTGSITTMMLDDDTNHCRFVLQSYNMSATMFQRIDLSNKWNSNSWSYSQAVLNARMGSNVRMELRGISINNSVLAWQTLSSKDENIALILRSDMHKLEVFIKFSASIDHSSTSAWCNYIRLFIIYDAHKDFQRIIPNIPLNAKWKKNGVISARGHSQVMTFDRISPCGIYIDDDQTMVISDFNNRVVEWMMGDTSKQMIVGENKKENRSNSFYKPTDVLIDRDTDYFIICDHGNRRVVRWSRRHGTTEGEIYLHNITCLGLATDDKRYLYISDVERHEVRRYQAGNTNGTVVAGGHGKGPDLNQLNWPTYIFVDREQTLYVTDHENHRVIKWNQGATEGVIIAGGQDAGNALTQLAYPHGLFVDALDTLYVADNKNCRVMRWPRGAKEGTIIAGGKGCGDGLNQFYQLWSLSFDRYGNLYVVDASNPLGWSPRIHYFSIQ